MVRAVVLLAVVGFAAFMLSEPSRPGAAPSATTVAAPVAAASTPTPAPAPAATGAPLPARRQSVITEAQLNQQIALALAQRPDAPFREVRARLPGDNTVEVKGMTALAGRDVAVTVRLRLTMASGALNLDVVEAQAGPFPVPAGLAEALARQAAQAAGLPGLQGVALPPEVQSVEVREGVVVIGLLGP